MAPPGGSTDPASSAAIAELEAVLRSRDVEAFNAALRALVNLGAEGDQLLSGLEGLKGWRYVCAAAALGDVQGQYGGRFLRDALASSGPGTSDVRCAAALALAKRDRVDASELLAGLLGDRDRSVRDYALLGLAAFGDARAWEVVFARLEAMTARPRKTSSVPSSVVLAVIYLLRHADATAEGGMLVRSLLRRRQDRLKRNEHEWLNQYWPSAIAESDSVPGLPDPVVLHRWILHNPLIARPAIP